MTTCRHPCNSCPWRKEQHADEIPGFKIELAENLIHTTEGELQSPIFACHQSTPDQEVVCVGWLWRYGIGNIQIRLRLIAGKMRVEELDMPHEYDEILHNNFDQVITKLREDVGNA
jgi:hypothetical protein